jgi:hypothetical protein
LLCRRFSTGSHDGGEIEIVDDPVRALIVLSDHEIPVTDVAVGNPDLPEKVMA